MRSSSCADPPEHFRKLGPRHDAVLHVVVRRDAAHRRKRRLAALPDPLPLLVVAARLPSDGAGLAADRFDDREQLVHFRGGTVELDDQHGVGVGKVRMDRRFGGVDRRADPSSRRPPGRCPRAMIADTASPPPRRSCRTPRAASAPLRPAQDAHDDFRDDRQRAFRSDQQAEQIGAGRVGKGTADVHELAVGQDGLDAKHVMHGEAVLEAMRAAGVFGDVPADRADLLTRRIGRVVVAEGRNLFRDLEIGDAGFDGDPAVGMSTSSTRFIRDSPITTPSATGSAPPDRPVPCRAPRTARRPARTHEQPAALAPLNRAIRRQREWPEGAAAHHIRRRGVAAGSESTASYPHTALSADQRVLWRHAGTFSLDGVATCRRT